MDTFILQAVSLRDGQPRSLAWAHLRYYTRLHGTDEPFMWLADNAIGHVYGWDAFPSYYLATTEVLVLFLQILDPAEAVAFRLRWNAQAMTLTEVRTRWDTSREIRLLFPE